MGNQSRKKGRVVFRQTKKFDPSLLDNRKDRLVLGQRSQTKPASLGMGR